MKKFGLIGYPISHSLSPALFKAAYNGKYIYDLIEIEDFETAYQKFLDEYYAYVDKIYNYQIPIKMIASKGKIKKSLDDYVKDCNTITKAGRPKSRQAWMELALKENLNVHMGETIYYINTGKSKSQADVKKVTHYYGKSDDLFGGEKKDMKVTLEKEYKKNNIDGKLAVKKDKLWQNDWVKKHYPEIIIEDETLISRSTELLSFQSFTCHTTSH